MPTEEQDTFVVGGILAVLGLCVILSRHDLLSGFFLLGLGVVLWHHHLKNSGNKFSISSFKYLKDCGKSFHAPNNVRCRKVITEPKELIR